MKRCFTDVIKLIFISIVYVKSILISIVYINNTNEAASIIIVFEVIQNTGYYI
jgi:hypothetical protein